MRLAALIFCLACTVPHSGLNAGDSSTRDVGTDVGGRDAGNDGGTDTGVDVGTRDVGVDAGMDAGVDVGTDVGPLDVGVSDATRCSIGTDSDGDGVSDECDVCGDGDDAIDGDGDGIPDACDTWLCGELPMLPSTVMAERITISNARLGGGGATSARTFSSGSNVRVRFDWRIRESDSCTGCLEQVEVGVSPGGRLTCAYDGNPNPESSGSFDETYVLEPEDVGRIDVRFNLGLRRGCNDDGNVWWTGEPPEAQTVAVICVPPT